MKGRILVVDDIDDVRVTVAGMLADEGYGVQVAATYEEAVERLQNTRFHVAILDVRLDETDIDNEAGLHLMHYIHEMDSTTAIIILTGYAEVRMIQDALRPGSDGQSLAFNFLEKFDIGKLPQVVEQALEQAVCINLSLDFEDPGQVILGLAKRVRFQNKIKPNQEALVEEIEDLLCKLFNESDRIQIKSPQNGYSAAAVFKVVPWFGDRGRGEALIVKIGESGIVDEEVERYNTFLDGLVVGNRVPTALNIARTRSLSGILYTFVGLGVAKDFSIFFSEAGNNEVQNVLRNLYQKTCSAFHRNAIISSTPVNLQEIYFKELWLNPVTLEQGFQYMMGKRHPFHLEDTGRVWLGEEVTLLNPVAFVQKNDFQFPALIGIIHGELQGYNVLVDQFQQTWLIDFACTTRGPIAQDYALFETFLLISAVADQNWQTIYQWHRILFETRNMTAVPLSPKLKQIETIQKAHTAILTIRRLAFVDAVILSEEEYLISLLFNSLKLLTILNLPAKQRNFALIASALVAERLARLMNT